MATVVEHGVLSEAESEPRAKTSRTALVKVYDEADWTRLRDRPILKDSSTVVLALSLNDKGSHRDSDMGLYFKARASKWKIGPRAAGQPWKPPRISTSMIPLYYYLKTGSQKGSTRGHAQETYRRILRPLLDIPRAIVHYVDGHHARNLHRFTEFPTHPSPR